VTIRGDRSPRGPRDRDDPLRQAHPISEDEAIPQPTLPTPPPDRPPRPRNGNDFRNGKGNGYGNLNGNGRGRRRGPGIFRFLLFALVLAAFVLGALATVLRPLVAGAVVDWAAENPSALRLPFVADLVQESLGDSLTKAPGVESDSVLFTVAPGDTAGGIADRLRAQGFLRDARAFVFLAIRQDLTSKLQQGTFLLRKNMTPQELVEALLEAKSLTIQIQFREGLRLEQMTAKLETLSVTMDVQKFYDLVKHPTPAVLAAHPWLVLPKGASLEGFLYPATYTVLPSITPEELVDQMLQTFYETVGADRMTVPKARGLTFYQVITLASIVEREAVVDEERPLIAGVYQNRMNPKLFPNGLFEADPTVLYANDTVELDKLPLAQWTGYTFWAPLGKGLNTVVLPDALAGYQTYTHKGLIPGPICTPSVASIDAALEPDTKAGYLFFVAKHDGSNTHAFAGTYAEHQANLKKYGYR
jgi:UPF0755 protein